MANSYFQGYCDSLIQSPDFISFSRRVYDIVERNAPSAMILERICYWHGTSAKTGKSRLMVESDGKLWLAKNYADWEDECCVNPSTARKALDRLETMGIIETKIGKFQGVNSVLIRVIPEQFEYLSNRVGVSVQNGHLVSVQNGHLHIQESKTVQESTTTTLPPQKSAANNGQSSIQESSTKTKKSPKPKTPKPEETPAYYVNLTNEKLERPRPVDMSEDEYNKWLRQKPIWSLFAMWEVWNRTQGWQNRTVEYYQRHAVNSDWGKLCQQVQNMGRWLDTLAEINEITVTYELLAAWNDYYLATNFAEKPISERKYPTTQDGFERNFSLYLTYRNTKEPQP